MKLSRENRNPIPQDKNMFSVALIELFWQFRKEKKEEKFKKWKFED